MSAATYKGIKHPLNIAQVKRSEGARTLGNKSWPHPKKASKPFRSVDQDFSESSYPAQIINQKLMQHNDNLREKAAAIVNEAGFIGLIKPEHKQRYLSIALANRQAFTNLKEILKFEKQELVKRYDALLRHDQLSTLEWTEYEKLYKAKYLTAPSKTNKQFKL